MGEPEQRPDQNATHGEGWGQVPTPVHAEVDNANQAAVKRRQERDEVVDVPLRQRQRLNNSAQ
jgi:hypothetical protein